MGLYFSSSLCIISTRLPLCLLVCQSVSPSLQTHVSLIRPAYEKSLLEFDWVWLFVPILMASQSDLFSVTITSTFFPMLFILVKFPKLIWFAGADLFLQAPQLLDEVCSAGLIWFWTAPAPQLTKWTSSDNECVNPACAHGAGGLYWAWD